MKSALVLFLLLLISCEKKDTSRMIVDGKLEPAEPSEDINDSTLLGVDSNGDGVRDDVERWINREFPNETDYNYRQLSKQATIEISRFLMPYEGLGKKEFKKIFDEIGGYSKCASYIFEDALDNPDPKFKFVVFVRRLRKKLLNNDKRKVHYYQFQSNFHLMRKVVDVSTSARNCKFKPRRQERSKKQDKNRVESEIPNQIVAGKKGDSDNDGVRDDLELFIYSFNATKDSPIIRSRMYNIVFYSSRMMDTCRDNWKTELCFQKYVEHRKMKLCPWVFYNPKLRKEYKLVELLSGISRIIFKSNSDAKLYGEMNNDFQEKVSKRGISIPGSSKEFCQGELKL